MSDDRYDEDYFLRGKATGKSLYEDYRWMPELTVPMCRRIIEHCGIREEHSILDFGCARGYSVRALRELGFAARGVDVSGWAIANADPVAAPYCLRVHSEWPAGEVNNEQQVDWIMAKDVLEHVYFVKYAIKRLMRYTRLGLFVVVPLSEHDNSPYVVPDYEKDVTHCQRMTLTSWLQMFLQPGWSVEASYRVPGIKDNYYKSGWEKANGFITARRVEE